MRVIERRRQSHTLAALGVTGRYSRVRRTMDLPEDRGRAAVSNADQASVLKGAADEIRTFLVADVRGYTAFAQEHGDQAAAGLAAKFAAVIHEHVEARDGSVI